MSALPRHPRDHGYAGLRMTADKYLALGETPDRYELIDGVVFMSPSPSYRHQTVLRLILKQVEAGADQIPGAQIAFDTDIRFAAAVVYRPDLAVYRPGRLRGVPDRLDLAPDLAVEILSPGTEALDLTTKRADYERFGVGEYWVIDPGTLSARCWRRKGGKFVKTPTSADSLESHAVPGIVLDLRSIRRATGLSRRT